MGIFVINIVILSEAKNLGLDPSASPSQTRFHLRMTQEYYDIQTWPIFFRWKRCICLFVWLIFTYRIFHQYSSCPIQIRITGGALSLSGIHSLHEKQHRVSGLLFPFPFGTHVFVIPLALWFGSLPPYRIIALWMVAEGVIYDKYFFRYSFTISFSWSIDLTIKYLFWIFERS